MQQIIHKLRHDTLFIVTTILVMLASVFGLVSWNSISWPTVLSLSALLGLVTLFQSLGFIDALADYFIQKAQTTRSLILAIFLLTFFSAMVVTNDVAILTFLPLTFALAKKITLPVIKVAVLITIYANLGSSVSPIGNPQNIYLLAHYRLNFLAMAVPAFLLLLLGLISMLLLGRTIPKTPIKPIQKSSTLRSFSSFEKIFLGLGSIIVLLSLVTQSNLLESVVLVGLLIFFYDSASFKEIDYGVVLSIINFFLLVSVLIRLPAIASWLSDVGRSATHVLLAGVLSSQLISNVPAAALFAPITTHFTALYLAVSVGGFGTLVASLANLLAFRQIKANAEAPLHRNFFFSFTKYNLLFLFLGILFAWIILLIL
ncbi:Na+/H+ antiporter NhaD or related arsenite permease (ArsB) [Fructobacillus fructosus]|uniref:SLC13 family permease n=1 Tax=Fructobacillus fructosus TaxID=1631 RepID=UPI002D9F4EEB|nr:Na+/H+ antiporter NhaD or related arsenite permease (ArsB) [Fructobacillus fructosus]